LRKYVTEKDFRLEADVAEAPRMICPYCPKSAAPHIFPTRTLFLAHIEFLHLKQIDADWSGRQLARESDIRMAEKTLSKLVKTAKLVEMGFEAEASESESDTDESNNPESSPVSDHSDELVVTDAILALRDDIIEVIQREPLEFFTVLRSYVSEKSNRFKLFSKTFQIKLNRNGRAAACFGLGLVLMEALFIYLTRQFQKRHRSNDKFYIQFAVDSDNLNQPVTSPYLTARPESIAQYMTDLTMTSTSHPLLFLDNALAVTVQCLGVDVKDDSFQGDTFGGFYRGCVATETEFAIRKHGFGGIMPNIIFKNDCLLVAVALGLRLKNFWVKRVRQKSVNRPTQRGNILRLKMFTNPLQCKNLKFMIRRLASEIGDGKINWNIPQTVETCELAQQYLNEQYALQLVVYRSYSPKDIYFFGGPKRAVSSRICLILIKNHLSLITDPLSYFNLKTCGGCFTLYKNRHSFCSAARKTCYKCGMSDCRPGTFADSDLSGEDESRKICTVCEGYFFTKQCYANHLRRTERSPLSACATFWFCKTCGKKFARAGVSETDSLALHPCLQNYCQKCGSRTDLRDGKRHLCALQKAMLGELGVSKLWASKWGIGYHTPGKAAPLGVNLNSTDLPSRLATSLETSYVDVVGWCGIVAFDFETRCNSDAKLCPYLATALFMCTKCAFIDPHNPSMWPDTWSCCGLRRRCYIGPVGVREFILDLFFRKRQKKVTAWSFNGSSFDSIIILNTLIQNGVIPKIKMKGRKIMLLRHNNVTLKDLRCFLSGCLAAIPKNFKLDHIVEKG
jgi:hypothetical protein